MNCFYIYRWIRVDLGIPFYIGKGKGSRAYDIKKRNDYFKRILNVTECYCEIVSKDLCEGDAFNLEQKLIKLYKTYGYCAANLSNGGEGPSGYNHTEDSKRKMSIAKKGKPLTEETKRKMSKVRKGRTASAEHIRKLSLVRKGQKRSEEFKEKCRQRLLGSKRGPHSEETKRKIGLANSRKTS